jgi:deoxycytidine triphosphate deaminase
MLLSGEEIKKRNIIENSLDAGFRASTYDVRIDKIISVSGEEHTFFRLKPQGMVLVISKERVKLPPEIHGYATVKTGRCHDGILATNIGIIDPGYVGLVSSYLINFGKNDFYLSAGDAFLRLAFHEFTPGANPPLAPSTDDESYVNERKREIVASLSETFLDLPANIKRVTDEVFSSGLKKFFVWAPVAALGLTIIVFAVTLGVTYGGREVPSREQLKAEFASEVRDKYYKNIEERLTKLEEKAQKAGAEPSVKQSTAPPQSKQRH